MAAAAVTASELALFGGSVSGERGRTTLLGGQTKAEKRQEQKQDEEATPSPDGDGDAGRGGHPRGHADRDARGDADRDGRSRGPGDRRAADGDGDAGPNPLNVGCHAGLRVRRSEGQAPRRRNG